MDDAGRYSPSSQHAQRPGAWEAKNRSMARKWRVLVLYECLIRVLGTALGGHEACVSLMLMLLMPIMIMIMIMVMMMTMLSRQSPLPLGEVAPCCCSCHRH
ncbi:hypothetical protein V8C34DRAFT_290934 [Trichoderma compactum]